MARAVRGCQSSDQLYQDQFNHIRNVPGKADVGKEASMGEWGDRRAGKSVLSLGARPRSRLGRSQEMAALGAILLSFAPRTQILCVRRRFANCFYGCDSRDASLRALETRHANDACA